MKRIVLTVTILLLSSVFAWAEISGVPQLVNYQGKLTDANGDPLATGKYKLEFNIYDDATGASIKWGPETFGSVPVVAYYLGDDKIGIIKPVEDLIDDIDLLV